MSFLIDVAVGYAQLLAQSVEGLAWAEDGNYGGGAVGVWVGSLPTDVDTAVAVMPYGLGDDAALTVSTVGVQITVRGPRGDLKTASDLDDAIADQLLGLWPVTLPNGIHIAVQERTSSASLGQDDTDRWRRVSNYTNTLHRPSIHRH